ncbi:MAG TPA: hypothetical protein VIG88_11015 [Lysobacter sp.]
MSPRPFVPVVLAALLAGCASASHVMISDPRPPVAVEQVRVYLQPPASRYVEIALLDARTGEFTYGAQNRDNTLMNRLRSEAAKLGANGVLLQERGQVPSASGVGIGVGGGGRHVGGGVSVGIGAPKERARAVAIWVPDAPGG